MTSIKYSAIIFQMVLSSGNSVRQRLRKLRQVIKDARLLRPSPGPVQFERGLLQQPFVVAGLFRTPSGIGRVAALNAAHFSSLGLNPVCVDLSHVFGQDEIEPMTSLSSMPHDQKGTLLLQLNAPETRAALHHLKMFKKSRPEWRVIGYWCWELDVIPDDWVPMAKYLSEIWVLSELTASAFQARVDVPVRVAPPPKASVPSMRGSATDARRFVSDLMVSHNVGDVLQKSGPDVDDFVCLACADGRSSFRRKNLMGAITAFKSAFGDHPKRKLIIKTRNFDAEHSDHLDVLSAISGAANISLIDCSLTDAQFATLIDASDVFLSLHRAEGFGLVIGEALQRGCAVLATSWGGLEAHRANADFHAVPYVMTDVNDHPLGPYAAWKGRAQWAEPNIPFASRCLTEILAQKMADAKCP